MSKKKKNKEQENEDIFSYPTPAYKPRKKRFGDRKDGRRLRTLTPYNYVIPYIMKVRADSQNHFEDVLDITAAEKYLDKKRKEGYTEMGLLHLFLASYVRLVSERPAVNRFIAGQKIYARNNIQGVMTIKKRLAIDSPDTSIKVTFDPRDSVPVVYQKFQAAVEKATSSTTDFDNTARLLTKIPGLLFRFTIGFLRFLDYFGKIPNSLVKVSPFHGSFVITSMGSLGINAIYHHLYDFGNIPVFISYGKIFSQDVTLLDGTVEHHHFVTLRVVTDERICDGYYYASAFKKLKRYMLNPDLLDTPVTHVTEDVD